MQLDVEVAGIAGALEQVHDWLAGVALGLDAGTADRVQRARHAIGAHDHRIVHHRGSERLCVGPSGFMAALLADVRRSTSGRAARHVD